MSARRTHRPLKRRRASSSVVQESELDTLPDDQLVEYDNVFVGRVLSSRVPVPAVQSTRIPASGSSSSQHEIYGRGARRDQGPSTADDDGPENGAEAAAEKPANHWKTSSASMSEFQERRDIILDALFFHEFDPLVSATCSCSSGNMRHYRCVDCLSSRPCCKACIVSTHKHTPFHRIQQWTGAYFARSSLHRLGAEFCLGHGGERCPNAQSVPPVEIVAVHTNGLHKINMVYCLCAPFQKRPLQLLCSSLYPSTWDNTATIFSFELLDRYHIESLLARVSAHDFWAALCSLTDNTRIGGVPNRYQELLRVSREWRALMRLKRSGQELGISALLPDGSDSTAVLCPACPRPGWNMEPDWESLVNEDNVHVYTVFIGIDGNFKAVLKKKKFDANDRPLLDGQGFFAETEAFKEHMKIHKVDDAQEHQSTCSNLKSMKAMTRRKGIVISGVAAIFCRHGYYQPGAMVDLELGEKFRILDYAVAQALKSNPHPRLRRVLTCDKGCQYGVNLVRRFETTFPDLVPLVQPLKVLVPKMHLQGHKEECRYFYSLNYTPHCGRTDGEHVERPWVDSNETAKITRDQNPGHRKDTYDDTNNAWNYGKNRQAAPAILGSLRKMYKKRAEAIDNAHALDLAVGAENVAEWSRQPCEARRHRGEVYSVYRVNRSMLPKFDEVVAALRRTDAAPEPVVPEQDRAFCPTAFLSSAMKLEQEQVELECHIKELSSKDKPLVREQLHDICLRRGALRNDITTFRLLQQIHMSSLGPTPSNDIYTSTLEEDFGRPETEPLNLPSEWGSAADRERFGFTKLAELEYDQRLALAARSLARMRAAIHAYNAFRSWKDQNVSGQRQGTRAYTQVETNAREIDVQAACYRRHFAALARLGIKPNHAQTYRPLLDADLHHLHVHSGNPEGLGESQRPQPWYWGGDRDADEAAVKDLETLTLEELRVRWFRARANKDRFCEEVDILHAELARTHRMFGHMKAVWTTLAGRQTEDDCTPAPGDDTLRRKHRRLADSARSRQAYSLKQASIYRQREWEADRACQAAESLRSNYDGTATPGDSSTDSRPMDPPAVQYAFEWSYY